MKRIKRGIIFIILLTISMIIFKSNIIEYLNNVNMSYNKYVYLGGDDITVYINNDINTNNNSVTTNNVNAASGILTFIDYTNNTYGAIAHNIIEKEEAISGNIYASEVIEINKSNKTIGNKTTVASLNDTYGTVNYASNTGIYGEYSGPYKDKTPIQIAMPTEVKKGTAYIVTTLNGTINQYKIEITNINMFRKDKNITFKVIDQNLINETGGIIQGMSGSPIIQNGKIIGALSHSFSNNFLKGNAIFITNMIK